MELLSPQAFRAVIRSIGDERYHSLHPFHRLLHSGELRRGQVQAWVLNRFCYQSAIPRKDATIVARSQDPEFRREWRRRIIDHDGDTSGEGGIARWLALAKAVDLNLDDVRHLRGVLPATRFAVEEYVRFVGQESMLEAVASSLTELFAPGIIAERMEGMIGRYDFIDDAAMVYFKHRLDEAPRDSEFALHYVVDHARTADDQQAVLAAVRHKCDILWAQLDALYHAYVNPGHIPPGAFIPDDHHGLALP